MHAPRSSLARAWYRLTTRLHGHEMFVAGDVARVVALFSGELWTDVTAERWCYDHAPLPRYPTPAADVGYVRGRIKSYDLKSNRRAANERHGLAARHRRVETPADGNASGGLR